MSWELGRLVIVPHCLYILRVIMATNHSSLQVLHNADIACGCVSSGGHAVGDEWIENKCIPIAQRDADTQTGKTEVHNDLGIYLKLPMGNYCEH